MYKKSQEWASLIAKLSKVQDVNMEKSTELRHKHHHTKCYFQSAFTGSFSHIVVDKGHHMKMILSHWHQAMALLEMPHIWFLCNTHV